MEQVYVPFLTYNRNMLLSVYSSARRFTGAVFLCRCCYPNARTIGYPFHFLWIMGMGCTSPVFTLLKLCLWQWLGALVLYQVDYHSVWHPVQWGHRMRTLFQQDKGIVPALWIMQFKWEYIHSSRKGQFKNQWTFDRFWACRQYCFY